LEAQDAAPILPWPKLNRCERLAADFSQSAEIMELFGHPSGMHNIIRSAFLRQANLERGADILGASFFIAVANHCNRLTLPQSAESPQTGFAFAIAEKSALVMHVG
jgi:hypothetical protein